MTIGWYSISNALVLDRGAELALELHAVHERRANPVREHFAGPATAALCRGERRVGVAQQAVHVVIRRRLRDACARADRELASVDGDGPRERVAHALADLYEVALVGHVLEQQSELIGAGS